MAQESTDSLMQYAKDLAKAEKELEIERWVIISIKMRLEDGSLKNLHQYDIPHRMLNRWQWVIDWRQAKLKCSYPRNSIQAYHSYYDKQTGLNTGFGSLLSRLSSAKAQVTKMERIVNRYIEYNTANNLFFSLENDEQLVKASQKLEQKRKNVETMYDALRKEALLHQEKNSSARE
jgi:hypothetical protein